MELSDGFVTSPNMRVNIELSKLGWMSSMNSQGGQGQPGDHVRQGEQEGEGAGEHGQGGQDQGRRHGGADQGHEVSRDKRQDEVKNS